MRIFVLFSLQIKWLCSQNTPVVIRTSFTQPWDIYCDYYSNLSDGSLFLEGGGGCGVGKRGEKRLVPLITRFSLWVKRFRGPWQMLAGPPQLLAAFPITPPLEGNFHVTRSKRTFNIALSPAYGLDLSWNPPREGLGIYSNFIAGEKKRKVFSQWGKGCGWTRRLREVAFKWKGGTLKGKLHTRRIKREGELQISQLIDLCKKKRGKGRWCVSSATPNY